MKKLGITEGKEVKIIPVNCEIGIMNHIEIDETKVAIIATDIGITPDEEVENNSKFIADAFETANRCGKLFSQVLEDRDRLLQVLQDISFRMNEQLEHGQITVNKHHCKRAVNSSEKLMKTINNKPLKSC